MENSLRGRFESEGIEGATSGADPEVRPLAGNTSGALMTGSTSPWTCFPYNGHTTSCRFFLDGSSGGGACAGGPKAVGRGGEPVERNLGLAGADRRRRRKEYVRGSRRHWRKTFAAA